LLTWACPLLAGALCILALDLARAVLELACRCHTLNGVVRVRLEAQPHLADAALLRLCIPHLAQCLRQSALLYHHQQAPEPEKHCSCELKL